jgi:hypothetical protein
VSLYDISLCIYVIRSLPWAAGLFVLIVELRVFWVCFDAPVVLFLV